MDVVRTIKQLFTECELMDTFNGSHVDYLDDTPNSYGIDSNGSVKLKETITGTVTYQHTFVLYAIKYTFEDYERLQNSSWLLELTYWLNGKKDIPITANYGGVEKHGVIQSIRAGNAMPYQLVNGDINSGIMYQLQINVTYQIMED